MRERAQQLCDDFGPVGADADPLPSFPVAACGSNSCHREAREGPAEPAEQAPVSEAVIDGVSSPSRSSTAAPVTTILGRWVDYFNVAKDPTPGCMSMLNHLADFCVSPHKGYLLNARHWLHNSSMAVVLLRKLFRDRCLLGGLDFVRENMPESVQHLAGNEALEVLFHAIEELCDQVALYHQGLHLASSGDQDKAEIASLRKQLAEMTADYQAEKVRRIEMQDKLRKAQQCDKWVQRMSEIPASQWVTKVVDGGSELLKEVMATGEVQLDWPHALEVLDKAWAIRFHEARSKSEADLEHAHKEQSRLQHQNELLRERAATVQLGSIERPESPDVRVGKSKPKLVQARPRSSSTSGRARTSTIAGGEKASRAAPAPSVLAFGSRLHSRKAVNIAQQGEVLAAGRKQASLSAARRSLALDSAGKPVVSLATADGQTESWARLRDADKAAQRRATSACSSQISSFEALGDKKGCVEATQSTVASEVTSAIEGSRAELQSTSIGGGSVIPVLSADDSSRVSSVRFATMEALDCVESNSKRSPES